MKKIKNNLYFVKMFAFTLIAALVLIGESRAAATCAWESEGSTKLIISGDGTFNSSDCTLTNWKTTATALEIKSGITEIGNNAFYGMSRVTGSLVIPDSVTSIGYQTFYGMSRVTGLVIPNSITNIRNGTFGGMSGVTGSLVIPNSVTRIEDHAFSNMSGVTNLSIPNSVTYIGYGAFSGMNKVKTLIIPNSLTTINEGAFYDMKGVTTLTIPNSVTEIGKSAFSGMSGVTGSVVIPNSVTKIGDYAFQNMEGVTGSLVIPNSVTKIGQYAFRNMNNVTEITFPASVTRPGTGMFSGMNKVKTLTIPDNLKTIGWNWTSKIFEGFTANITVSCMGQISGCQNALKRYLQGSGGTCTSNCLNVTAFINNNKYLCEIPDKTLDCSMLHYTYSSAQKDAALKNPAMVCTQCPTDADYWSCATRATDASQYIPLTSFDITPKTGGVSGCVALPTCEDLGYVFSSVKVSGVPASYSCSACPFDGSKWACAGSGGLVKPQN